MSEYKWTYNRRQEPCQIKLPEEGDSGEFKNAFEAIQEMRGIFNSKEEVENYIRIQNTPDCVGVNADGTPQLVYK